MFGRYVRGSCSITLQPLQQWTLSFISGMSPLTSSRSTVQSEGDPTNNFSSVILAISRDYRGDRTHILLLSNGAWLLRLWTATPGQRTNARLIV